MVFGERAQGQVVMGFELNQLHMSSLINKMENNEYFTLSRHKDGEFYAIFEYLQIHKRRYCNCDKHIYYKDMGKALLETLVYPRDYIYGMQPLVFRNMIDEVSDLFDKYKIDLKWYASDIFHHAVRDGQLFPFIDYLNKMRVVIIGPERIKPIKELLTNVEFVTIPSKNCWLEREKIVGDILKISADNTVYLFSSSMPTAVFIHQLYPMIGKKSWLIDFGSIWECLLGINIRNYQKRIPKEVMDKNFERTK